MKKLILGTIAALLTAGCAAGGATVAHHVVEQNKRDAYCASMDEVWVGDHWVDDPEFGRAFMPGQCMDLGGTRA